MKPPKQKDFLLSVCLVQKTSPMPGFPRKKKSGGTMLSYQPGRLKNEALVLDIIFSFSRNLGGLYVYIILNLPSKFYESDVFLGDQTDRGGPSKKHQHLV